MSALLHRDCYYRTMKCRCRWAFNTSSATTWCWNF